MKKNKFKERADAKKINMDNVRYKNAKAKRDKKNKKVLTISLVSVLVAISMIFIIINTARNNNSVENSDDTNDNVLFENDEENNNKSNNEEKDNVLVKEESNKMKFDQFDSPQKGDYIATIETTFGNMTFRLFTGKAPKAVENFVTHAKDGYYNNMIFHRVVNDFMIQTGDPTGTGYYGDSIWGNEFEDELSPDLSLFTGALAMANHGPNTNQSQFFIVQAGKVDDSIMSQLKNAGIPKDIIDSYAKHGGTPQLDYRFTMSRHTVFGQIIDGMNVVNDIAKVKTNEKDKPLEDVKINGVKIEKVE